MKIPTLIAGGKLPTLVAGTMCALAASAAMEVADLQKRFADTNVYAFVAFEKGGFDLGKTVNYPGFFEDGATMSQRGTNYSCTAIVPCEQYVRAYILCDVMSDPKRDPAFAIRLLRHVSAPPGWYWGRSFDSMAQETVDLTGKTGRQLVEVRMKTGEIEDIIFTDKRGDFDKKLVADELKRQGLKKYLDLELIGRPFAVRHPFRDMRNFVDPSLTSGVRVLAVALEKPSAEMQHSWSEPGNIFHNDEKPETFVEVRVKRPGAHRLVWTIKDVDGNVVKTETHPFSKDEKLTLDLAMPDVGWYEIDWGLFDGERLLLTHRSSFALLGQDTRKAGRGEPPYECDIGLNHAHYKLSPKDDQEIAGKLMLKLGMRRSPGIDSFLRMDEKLMDKYLLSSGGCGEFWGGEKPEIITNKIDKRLAVCPDAKKVMVLYESSPDPDRHAEEITGGIHSPSNDLPGASKRVAGVRTTCEYIKKHYPDIKITLGNSLTCSEIIAEQMRAGLPKECVDYMGSETVQRNNLPESLEGSSIQAVDCYRELAKHYGYPWGVNSCTEHCYRLDTLIGEDLQAWWYVRDLVLMQCWRFPDIFLAETVDAGNHYTDQFWGSCGVNRRTPYIYPKKAFVALATATKVLDQVVSRRHVPTGDDCVHAVEFAKKDGTYAYAIWAVTGEADLEFETTDDFQLIDIWGRTREPQGTSFWNFLPFGNGKYRLTAGEKMTYLVSETPCLAAIKCVARRYETKMEKDYRVLMKTDAAEVCTKVEGVFETLEREPGHFPCRHAGKGSIKTVVDEERGNCVEIELGPMSEKYPTLVSEYATFLLKKPIPLKDAPATLVAWVKGNSGWGQFYFILKDGNGQYRVNADSGYGDMEFEGLAAMTYSGWKPISFPLNVRSHIRDRSSDVCNLWTHCTPLADDGSLTLVGFAFDAHRKPLYLDEHREKRQVIRVGEIGACDWK